MRKRILLATVLLTFALAGCGSSSEAPAGNSSEIDGLKAQIEELEKENADLKAQLEAIPEETEEETESQAVTGQQIAVGDTITTDSMEITINKVELSYDVLPDDTSGLYTHYAAEEGNVYLHIDADVKNLGKQNLSCDKIMKVTADYNGGYTYKGSPVPEDSNTGFTYANITSIKPLESLGVHFLSQCPQEVEESDYPLFLTLEPYDSSDSYILTVR